MESRMKNPALVLEGANAAIQQLVAAVFKGGLSPRLLDFVSLRIGQINNCELCIGQTLSKAESDVEFGAQLHRVSNWSAEGGFSAGEQVALELAEAVTYLRAKYESVSNELWTAVEQEFDEQQRAALIVFIALMNMFTRMNIATRQTNAQW